jgi:hypothetical protein
VTRHPTHRHPTHRHPAHRHPAHRHPAHRHPALDAGSIFINMDDPADRMGLVCGINPPKRIFHTQSGLVRTDCF